MSYRFKTLIVFDTNSLRKIRNVAKNKDGIINYSNFDFGTHFMKIKESLEEKKIRDIVHLGIPEMVIYELKNQCEKQFYKDYILASEAFSRICEIPFENLINFTNINPDFNYKEFINIKIEEKLERYNIVVIPFDESKTVTIFRNMIEKVLDIEDVKSPFRPKDAGFKDNIIWESLIRHEGISGYEKIFFLTRDGDFKDNCYEEFKQLWPEKEISIRKDETQIILEIERIYKDYLEEKTIWDFTDSSFFIDSLKNELKNKTLLMDNDNIYEIEGFNIEDNCYEIEKVLPDENDTENIIIYSKIGFTCSSKDKHFVLVTDAKTTLFDEESKEIISIEFDVELI